MRDRCGEVRLFDDEPVVVTLRPRLFGGWRGTVGTPSADAAPRRRARLLGLRDAIVVAGPAFEVDARIERLCRARRALVEAPVGERAGVRCSLLAPQSRIAELPPGVRGVPGAVALAALARALGAPERCAVFWSYRDHTLLTPVVRGRPHGGHLHGWPCLLVTRPDARWRRWLRDCGVARALPLDDPELTALSPLALLAVGVALAYRAPGTFPAPTHRFRTCLHEHALTAAALTLVTGAACFWWPRERDLPGLERTVHAERRALEQLRWEARR